MLKSYYGAVLVSVFLSVTLIFKGLADPFGELQIICGAFSLLLFPVLLKLVFSYLFKQFYDGKSKR